MSVVSYDDATPCSLAVAPFLLFDDVLVPGAVFVQKPQFFLPALIFYVLSLVRTLFILYPTDLGPRERFVGSGIPLRCCCTSTHFRFRLLRFARCPHHLPYPKVWQEAASCSDVASPLHAPLSLAHGRRGCTHPRSGIMRQRGEPGMAIPLHYVVTTQALQGGYIRPRYRLRPSRFYPPSSSSRLLALALTLVCFFLWGFLCDQRLHSGAFNLNVYKFGRSSLTILAL